MNNEPRTLVVRSRWAKWHEKRPKVWLKRNPMKGKWKWQNIRQTLWAMDQYYGDRSGVYPFLSSEQLQQTFMFKLSILEITSLSYLERGYYPREGIIWGNTVYKIQHLMNPQIFLEFKCPTLMLTLEYLGP